MKFNFKIQKYQTDAVDAVIKAFAGQGFHDHTRFIRDLGKMSAKDKQMQLGFIDNNIEVYDPSDDTGYKNELVEISDEQLLHNIQEIQSQNNIKRSASLVKDLGRCSLDIEMETGTGKTYVYIKTMFELNKNYGWSKFIVVVPSIAIREGVKKSFEITADHFMEHYGKKARFFVYDSSSLNQLDNFSSNAGINVMIINTQGNAFSVKTTDNAAGSYGIGKAAPFVVSGLQTVFYRTYDVNGDRAAQGVTHLVSFEDEKMSKPGEDTVRRSTGYYGDGIENKPFPYIEELDNINERNEYGTDLFIPVFSFASGKMDWKDEVIAEILDNFLYSIYSGKLEIKVDNIILNKDSLLTHITRLLPKTKHE